jgi:Zn-dependent oligopeptidase
MKKSIVTFFLIMMMTIAFAEENPFFKPFDRPYGTAPFNDIKMEHFEPAFEKGMEEHQVFPAAKSTSHSTLQALLVLVLPVLAYRAQ